jgi:tetratricopeptide (TPR) repeat protein
MPSLRQILQSTPNDYRDDEITYLRETGQELLSFEPLHGEDPAGQSRVAVVIPVIDEASAVLLPAAIRAWSETAFVSAFPGRATLVVAGVISLEAAAPACADSAAEVLFAPADPATLWSAINGTVAGLDCEALIFAAPDLLPSRDCPAELLRRQQLLPRSVLLPFTFPLLSWRGLERPDFHRDSRLHRPVFPENLMVASEHLKELGHGRTILDTGNGLTDLLSVIGETISVARELFVATGGFDSRIESWPHQLAWMAGCAAALGSKVVPVYAAAFGKTPGAQAPPEAREKALAGERQLHRRLQDDFDPRPLEATPAIVHSFPASAANGRRTASPAAPPSHIRLAKQALAAGQFARAVAELEIAGRNEEGRAAAIRMDQARAMAALGDYAQAHEALRLASAAGGERPSILAAMALLLAQEGRYGAARECLGRARALGGRDRRIQHILEQPASSHVARGRHHLSAGLHQLARRDFDFALLCDPDDPAARHERGRLLIAAGDVRRGAAELESALQAQNLDGRMRSALYADLGRAHLELGAHREAKLAWDRAADAQGGDASVRVALTRLTGTCERLHGFGEVSFDPSAAEIEGWLAPEEQKLLAQLAAAASALGPDFLEVGSYCGKSTVVIASVLRAVGARRLLYAVDPHQDFPEGRHETSLPILEANLRTRGLAPWVRIIQARSTDIEVPAPLAFIFIDGDHSFESVAADYRHFRDAVAPGGFLAFHDYSRHWPGVRTVVQGALEDSAFEFVSQRGGLIALRKSAEGAR